MKVDKPAFMENVDENEVFESKDKQIVPFLLTQTEVNFLGTRFSGDSLYFRFCPLQITLKLVNDFLGRKAPLVQPKELLDAVETYRDVVFGMKDKRRKYGGHF